MVVEESDTVTAEIITDPRFNEPGVHPPHITGVISIEVTSQDRLRVEDRIRVYPIMWAELIAESFDVNSGDADPRRVITATLPAAWTWNIVARESGVQRITVNIFGEEAVGNKEKRTVLEKSISQNITVLEKPLGERIQDSLIDDLPTIVNAIVGSAGLSGLIIAYLTLRANKKLKERVESLENKLKELEGAKATEGDEKS